MPTGIIWFKPKARCNSTVGLLTPTAAQFMLNRAGQWLPSTAHNTPNAAISGTGKKAIRESKA
jgi:hypothetical protein